MLDTILGMFHFTYDCIIIMLKSNSNFLADIDSKLNFIFHLVTVFLSF